MCGGTAGLLPLTVVGTGLSPRVRGNHDDDDDSRSRDRSIPACAGEPRREMPGWAVPQVYPRVCGGTTLALGLPLALAGLSPRVRGNPPLPPGLSGSKGSIPACAGEPSS